MSLLLLTIIGVLIRRGERNESADATLVPDRAPIRRLLHVSSWA